MTSPQPTRVMGGGDSWLARQRALAELAQASGRGSAAWAPGQSRHLAFLPADALDLDLSDPLQCDFGDYLLIEKLGQGGMGVVYKARQRSLDREVALKLLAAGPWASADFIERFRREAQSAARMQHPNIVAVYEIGSQDSLNYFSMALVRGEALAQRIARDGPLSDHTAARWMRTIAEAVDYAHRLGVLHLDLKPGNVLIDERGEPMVADFGLARRLDESLARDGDEVCGTPSYMAPEQAASGAPSLSPATDIHGLGAILYEMLCGRPPFLGATPAETLTRVVLEPAVPPRELRRGIDPDLEAICLRCLAKAPADRYPDARALAEDLGRFVEGREVSVRPLSPRRQLQRWARREPRLAIALGAFLCALAAGLTASSYQWRRAEGNAQAARQLLWEGRREAALQLEAEGRGFDALPRLLANLGEQEADGQDTAADERRVGILLGQAPRLVDRMVIGDANPLSIALGDGGRLLAVGCNDLSVRWYDTDSLAELGRVSLAGRSTSDGQPRTPMLLRFVGGNRLLVTLEWYANLAHPAGSDAWLVDLDAGRIVEPPPAFADFADAAFSSDLRHALLRDRQRRTQLWQVEPWRPLSALSPPAPEHRDHLLLPDGANFVFLRDVQQRLMLQSLSDPASPAVERAATEWGYSAWSTSHDGRRLALGSIDGRISLLDIEDWTLTPLQGSRGRQITWVGFSEDDRWLATANADGTVQLFDTQTSVPLVAGTIRHDFTPTRLGLSRARRLLLVAGEGRTALWRIPVPGSWVAPAVRLGSVPLAHGLAGRYAVDWSLDGGLLASAGLDGHVRLWRLPGDPLLPTRAAHQIPERIEFDGRQTLDVAWDRVRPVGADGRHLGRWQALPQPPGFAELIDEGRILLLTLGDRLELRDAADPAQVRARIDLPGTPQRLLPLLPERRRIVLGFGEAGPGHSVERLMLVDLDAGRLLPQSLRLHGPLRLLRPDADGARLVAIGPAASETTLIATDDLGVIAEYPHDSVEPVQWAAFAAGSPALLLARRAVDPRLGSDALVEWLPGRERDPSLALPAGLRPLALLPVAGGRLLFGSDLDALWTDTGERRPLQRLSSAPALAVVAATRDGRLVARAYRDAVQLHDAHSGELLGRPLQAAIGAVDGVAALAFAPDGRSLMARTLHGRTLVWRIAEARAQAEAIGAELAAMAASQDQQRMLVLPADAARRAARARDPGPWPAIDARPEPSVAGLSEGGEPIPARPADTPPELLDMGDRYEMAPDTVHTPLYRLRASMRPYPAGRQRIGGVDYDLRGMYHVAADAPRQARTTARSGRSLNCLPVPSAVGPVAAFHLLGVHGLRRQLAAGTQVARMGLQYTDGERREVALRIGRELPDHGASDPMPLVFSADPSFALAGLPATEGLVGLRVGNPEPGRPVRCIDLEFRNQDAYLLLFGVTAEPVLSLPAANVVSDR